MTANTNHEDTKQKAIKLQKKHHHLEKRAEKQNLTANTNHEDTKQKAIKLQKEHHHL